MEPNVASIVSDIEDQEEKKKEKQATDVPSKGSDRKK
jgi:hypothetical protein